MIPPQGWGETLLGRGKKFDFLTFEKNVIFYIKKSQKSSKLVKYKGIFSFWRLEKNPHEISDILVQKSLKTDNSDSSYDTFWVYHG